jgi:signal transduction histidine kinase
MAHDGTIRVTTGCGEGHVKILVHDSGPGLPDAVSGEVFKPFYTTRTEGTGLGLSIVKKVVEAHGGTVEATNPKEGGAEFRIRLPLTP